MKELNIKGSIVVADALNCQKETDEVIVKGKADYLLCVKDNHPNLKRDIEDFVHNKVLQTSMNIIEKTEKNRGRIEKRTAYITSNIDWLNQKMSVKIFVVSVRFIRSLKPKRENQANGIIIFQVVHYFRRSFGTMLGWNEQLNQCTGFLMFILMRIFDEDLCRVEDKNIQQNLNILRKAAINLIKLFKSDTQSKKAISKLCLIAYLILKIF